MKTNTQFNPTGSNNLCQSAASADNNAIRKTNETDFASVLSIIQQGKSRAFHAINISYKITANLSSGLAFHGDLCHNTDSIPLKPLNDAQMSGVFLFPGGGCYE